MPFEATPLFLVALLLVVGIVSGGLSKLARLPAVTGQILVGIVIGPSVVGLVDTEDTEKLAPVIDFAMSLMAVAVGSHLVFRRLRNAKRRLGLLTLLEATVTPILVATAVTLTSDVGWQLSALLAAVAVSTAPATILAIVKETRSRGVFVKTLVAAVALNNIVCIALFELAHSAASASLGPDLAAGNLGLLWAPLRQIALSAVVGGGVGVILVAATRRIVNPDRLAAASFVAILFTAGLGEQYDISPLLASLFLGVTLANLTPDKEEIGHAVFANFEYGIFAIFFTVAGAQLHFSALASGGVLAFAVFAARAIGKMTAATTAMKLARATRGHRRYLGVALIPQAGLAVGLSLVATEDPNLASIHQVFIAAVLGVVTLNEILGPILTRLALVRAGDYGKDRPRLIDFLHEENITTRLDADSKESAIGQLVDLLISTNRLNVRREKLLESVLERETLESTCLGEGLAIPHVILESGQEMYGAMGISQDGLPFETPDGQPIHCMILLATPGGARDRHLEVLAALARAIGFDPSIRHQLYHARTPAHAYDILHAEDHADDFNYFFDES